MMKDKICIFALLWTLFPLAEALGQDTSIDLYLNPDIYSQKIDSVSPDDPRLGSPSPVMDEAKAALGWRYATFTGSVEGYVPDAKIGKDMLPVDNAIIHARPDAGSPALGVYNFGNSVEIIDTGAWWKIKVETTFPVYFIKDSLPPVSLVEGPAESAAPQSQPAATGAITDDSVLFNTSVEPKTENAPPVTISQGQSNPQRVVVARSYTGSLEQSKPRMGFLQPKAPYQLNADSGKRLLWVTFAETIMPGTINRYLGKDVVVHGEPIKDDKSNDWILFVRSIRENN